MESEFWKAKWQRGETGWHQIEVEPHLVTWLGELAPTRVLVPLCGKSLDLTWLAEKGHEVVGVELSELACEGYFKDRGVAFTRSTRDGLVVFEGAGVRIFNADFFLLQPSHLGPIGAIYDRAALIALPPELRERYAAHLVKLARATAQPGFRMLLLVIEREADEAKGPPFTVKQAELEQSYGASLTVEPLSREGVEIGPENARAQEVVYRLLPRWF